MTKLTTEQFISRSVAIHGDKFSYENVTYKNNNTKVEITCKTCGPFLQIPRSHMGGRGCPNCTSSNSKLDFHEAAKERGYEVLGGYEYARKPVLVRHVKCGNEFKITPDNLKRGKSCPVCTGHCSENAKKKFIDALNQDGYSLISEYLGSATHIKIRHKKCGSEYMTYPSNFVRGHRCMKCHGKCQETSRTKFNAALVDDGYELISESRTARTRATVKHKDCGRIYKVTPDNFIRGQRCPSCSRSGFDQSKDGVLYILVSYCGTMMKIGISGNTKRRFADLSKATPFPFNPIEQLHGNGAFVAKAEKNLHSIAESASLTGFDGCTEWFKYDRSIIDKAVMMFPKL